MVNIGCNGGEASGFGNIAGLGMASGGAGMRSLDCDAYLDRDDIVNRR